MFRLPIKMSLYFIAFLGVMQLCTIATVYFDTRANNLVQLEHSLNKAAQLFLYQITDNAKRRLEKVQSYISSNKFKQAVLHPDQSQLISEIHTLGQEIQIDRIFLINEKYEVLVDTELSDKIQGTFPFSYLLTLAQSESSVETLTLLDDKIVQWSVIPISIETNRFYVALAQEIEPLFQQNLTLATQVPFSFSFAFQHQSHPWKFSKSLNLNNSSLENDLLDIMPAKSNNDHLAFIKSGEHIIFAIPLIGAIQNDKIAALLVYPIEDITAPNQSLIKTLVIITLIGIIIFSFLAYFVCAEISNLFQKMIQAFKRVKHGDYSVAIPNTGGIDSRQLIVEFNNMTAEIYNREKTALFQSRHDPVTTLPNRIYFYEFLSKRLKNVDEANTKLAIVAIAIDRFPQINHALGHRIGERLLQHVTSRLSGNLKEAEILAQLGNSVFIAIIPGLDATNYFETAHKITNLFETPFSVYTVNIDLDVLVGFSFFPEHSNDADVLIQKADVALYAARFIASRTACYNPAKDPHHFNKISLMSELREGLTQNEFEIFYQPKINLQSGHISQVESLVRWNHPVKGFMPPNQFIPLAEETGHIKKLTLWLIEKVIIQTSLWQQEKIDIASSVNLSVKDLANENLPEFVNSLIKEQKVDPTKIIFEVTESAFMRDPENAIKAIYKLKDLGVLLSLDDFGTGYSSLRYLKELPMNEIKIDQNFIEDMAKTQRAAQIVRSCIALAHSLNMEVVAEGISDKSTFDLLKSFGCDLGQGYLFCHPLSHKELMQWLKNSPWGLPLR